MPTPTASVQLQPADLHNSSTTPSKAAGKPSHRLQVQSMPSTAQALSAGQKELQEAGSAGPNAAGPDAAGPDAAGPRAVHQTSDAMRDTSAKAAPSMADVHTVGGPQGMESCDVTEPANVCTVADVDPAAEMDTMGSCSGAEAADVSRLPAARPRLRGLRLPWLTNQAGHKSEQVGPYLYTR